MNPLMFLSGRLEHRVRPHLLVLVLSTFLLCGLFTITSWQPSLAVAPPQGTSSPPCSILPQEDADALMGETMVLQQNMAMGGMFFNCIYTSLQASNTVDAKGVIATLTIAVSEETVAKLIDLSPDGEKLYAAMSDAAVAQDPTALIERLQELVESIPDAEVGATNVSHTFYRSEVIDNKKNILWLAFGKEVPLSLQIMAKVSPDHPDKAIKEVLLKTTTNVLDEFITRALENNAPPATPAQPGDRVATGTPTAPATLITTTIVITDTGVEIKAPAATEGSTEIGRSGCPNLTQADASELLQEPVREQAVESLLIATSSLTSTYSANFCGYLSQAFEEKSPPDRGAPTLVSPIAANSAVIVAKLNRGEYFHLLPLAEIVQSVSSERLSMQESVMLHTLLWGNNGQGVIDYLYHLAQNDANLHAKRVGKLSFDSAWIWIKSEQSNVAMLLYEYEGELNVIAALLGKNVDEEEVLATAIRLGMQMRRDSDYVAQASSSNECEFLNYATAMHLLNQPLPPTTDRGAGLCGYGGIATLLGEQETIDFDALPYGIAAGVLQGDEAHDLFELLAASLHQENPKPNEEAYAQLQQKLQAGDLAAVSNTLSDIKDKQQWDTMPTYGNYSRLYMKMTDDAEHIVIATANRPDGYMGFIIAHLRHERTPVSAFGYVERKNPDWVNKEPAVSQ